MGSAETIDDHLDALARLAGERPADGIDRMVAAARERMGMDLAVVAECSAGRETYRSVDGDAASFRIRVGGSFPLTEGLSERLLDGRISGIIGDVRSDHRVMDLPFTRLARVGSWIGVPVTLSNGERFGVLACLSHQRQPEVDGRDLAFLQVIARLVGDEVERQHVGWEKECLEIERIRQILQDGSIAMVFQPIIDLERGETVGVEALARFGSDRGPATWFEEAATVGLRTELELLAVAAALAQVEALPAGAFLSINASPETVSSPRLLKMLDGALGGRLVIEMTERAPVDEHPTLRASLEALRSRGALLAIDNSGAGFAGLPHLHRLAPDIVKLDGSLAHHIDHDRVRRSMAESVIRVAAEIDATVVAGGIESLAERETLLEMGVPYGQGWYLARPGPMGNLTRSIGFAG